MTTQNAPAYLTLFAHTPSVEGSFVVMLASEQNETVWASKMRQS